MIPTSAISGTTNALANVANWMNQPNVTPNDVRMSPAATRHSTASAEPTSRYAVAGPPLCARLSASCDERAEEDARSTARQEPSRPSAR